MRNLFDYFIVLAEMRTGSNFLETNLNAIPGLTCHGEAFNPHFIGHPGREDILGISREARDADPARLVEAIRSQPGLGGFRFFHDHDPRVLEIALSDPRCAKIVLTRNPLDSYVSWKIAQETGQWKLTNVKRRRDALAVFDGADFASHVSRLQQFQIRILNRLQTSGQTAFYLAYEDLQTVEVMNGLAKWLGSDQRIEALDRSLKPQNPAPTHEKVANPDAMQAALAAIDWFDLARTPNFEPRRGPAIPGHLAAVRTPLLYLPIRGGPLTEVSRWLAALDGVADSALLTGMNRRDLNQWKRERPGHRSFTVLRHPAARVHSVFCERILSTGPGSYARIRETLRRHFRLPIPRDMPGAGYDLESHRRAFVAFLDFLRANLAGQTALRVDAAWCTQAQALAGFAEYAAPDHLLREDEIATALPALARSLGHDTAPVPPRAQGDRPFALADIHDEDIERRIADIYRQDYLQFGFGPWAHG